MDMNDTLNHTSHFRMTSIGTVAADKNEGSKFISVYLNEHLPFLEAELTDQCSQTEHTGIDADGNAYNHTLQLSSTVKAEWKGTPNRVTSPSVKRGEQVEVWELGSTGMYYWHEMARDNQLRRKEAVTWAYGADSTPNTTDVPQTADNNYTISVDGVNGHITVNTSRANGEKAGYTTQMNGRDGHFTILDTAGNIVQMDSNTNAITLKVSTGEYITLASGKLTIQCPNIELIGNTTVNGNLDVSGNLSITRDTTGPNATFTNLNTTNLSADNNPT